MHNFEVFLLQFFIRNYFSASPTLIVLALCAVSPRENQLLAADDFVRPRSVSLFVFNAKMLKLPLDAKKRGKGCGRSDDVFRRLVKDVHQLLRRDISAGHNGHHRLAGQVDLLLEL